MTTTSTVDAYARHFDVLTARNANYNLPDHIDLLAEIAFKYGIPSRLRRVITVNDRAFSGHLISLLKQFDLSAVLSTVDFNRFKSGYLCLTPDPACAVDDALSPYTEEQFESDRAELVTALLDGSLPGGDESIQFGPGRPVFVRSRPDDTDGRFGNIVFPSGRIAYVREITDRSAGTPYGPITGSARPMAMKEAETELRNMVDGYMPVKDEPIGPFDRASFFEGKIGFGYSRTENGIFYRPDDVFAEEADEFICFLKRYIADYQKRIVNCIRVVNQRETLLDAIFRDIAQFITDGLRSEYGCDDF